MEEDSSRIPKDKRTDADEFITDASASRIRYASVAKYSESDGIEQHIDHGAE